MNLTDTEKELGYELGCSSRTISRKLVDLGLKDKKTQLPTYYALSRELADEINDEQHSFYRWNQKTLYYIQDNCVDDPAFCMQILFYRLKFLKHIDEQPANINAQGIDLQPTYFDQAYCKFLELWDIFYPHPQLVFHFVQRLEKLKLLSWIQTFDGMEDIAAIARQYHLETLLKTNITEVKKNKI